MQVLISTTMFANASFCLTNLQTSSSQSILCELWSSFGSHHHPRVSVLCSFPNHPVQQSVLFSVAVFWKSLIISLCWFHLSTMSADPQGYHFPLGQSYSWKILLAYCRASSHTSLSICSKDLPSFFKCSEVVTPMMFPREVTKTLGFPGNSFTFGCSSKGLHPEEKEGLALRVVFPYV